MVVLDPIQRDAPDNQGQQLRTDTSDEVGVPNPNTDKYSPDVSGMLVPAVAETNDVVEVCPGEVVQSMEQLYDETGECGRCIPQPKRHIAPMQMSEWGHKRGNGNRCFVKWNLPVTSRHVQLGEVLSLSNMVQQVFNPG